MSNSQQNTAHPARLVGLLRAAAVKPYRAEHHGPVWWDSVVSEQTLTEILSMPSSKENNWRPACGASLHAWMLVDDESCGKRAPLANGHQAKRSKEGRIYFSQRDVRFWPISAFHDRLKPNQTGQS
ncbi:hypothetical protein ACYZT7_10465 [Pseudomonas sp. RT4P38]